MRERKQRAWMFRYGEHKRRPPEQEAADTVDQAIKLARHTGPITIRCYRKERAAMQTRLMDKWPRFIHLISFDVLS